MSKAWAKLCQKMISDVSKSIEDDTIEGTAVPVSGGRLFRRHLLRSCQEVFERRRSDGPWAEPDNDRYQDARAENYRAFQMGPFIGSLFRLRIMPGYVMHSCIRQLLPMVDDQSQKGIECLSHLLVATGDKACMLEGWMDQQFKDEVTRLGQKSPRHNTSDETQSTREDICPAAV
ncbi:hypothetical protein CONPUDRAFT_73737 [Coniophora puteana RWD-64-598 SS2]|uniref:MIF4G domain-containing protein n=1 Tax=Coniophora puteana (strain RWD-64-598) TaxID=741705 RepID=A0A5M3MNB7_CONPW|nr:uncharacterized protein CONPUDRAFT_73737 [Coniophora puteana RWD-64-598 SS2]EIW80662.1 hypothetical protein CONPUDRAFT_73737 [Coniophora puteana RWD-64-598 SS2]